MKSKQVKGLIVYELNCSSILIIYSLLFKLLKHYWINFRFIKLMHSMGKLWRCSYYLMVGLFVDSLLFGK